ncbi:anthranilate synthase component I family protein [Gracilimonas sp. Q87]|uniref:anthranilate synthase component I family protein n=1 Tax=Gracilimonas sp. Q87 TaxID=3384766 RepID=UPI00398401F1
MKTNRINIPNLIGHLRTDGPVILLESQMPDHPSSTKSYVAASASAWIKARGDKIIMFSKGKKNKFSGDPWLALSEFYNAHRDWMFGYLGYDLKNYLENLESSNQPVEDAPDLFFFTPELLVEFDKDYNCKLLKGELPEFENSSYAPSDFKLKPAKSIDRQNYQDKIRLAQKDIYEGEYYEINLSHPLEFHFEGAGLDLYEKMKKLGPVPFGAYMSFDGYEVCSSSPERFLGRSGNKAWSQPIKGTAPKSGGVESARRLAESEKERAENLMIVDLVRNDLNRIAEKGSVKVSGLFEIQSFETVYQMVSTVECTLPEDTDSIELIKSCFPMGSMTGAPKIAAMKAIDNNEEYKRGIYSGALGYFSPNGDFDLNVIIRTAVIEGNKLVYPVGGAITSDSDPEQEWEETMLKAKAITDLFS